MKNEKLISKSSYKKQILLSVTGLLFIGLIIYGVYNTPQRLSILSNEIQQNQNLANELNLADQHLQQLKQKQQPAHQIAIKDFWSYVEQSAKQENFKVSITLKSQNMAYLAINFDKAVSMNQLLSWLTKLWLQEGIVVNEASFTRTSNPGLVIASLVLEAPTTTASPKILNPN